MYSILYLSFSILWYSSLCAYFSRWKSIPYLVVMPEVSSGYFRCFSCLSERVVICFHVQYQPVKTFETVTVIKINLTTEVFLIETLNLTMCTMQNHLAEAILTESSPPFPGFRLFPCSRTYTTAHITD